MRARSDEPRLSNTFRLRPDGFRFGRSDLDDRFEARSPAFEVKAAWRIDDLPNFPDDCPNERENLMTEPMTPPEFPLEVSVEEVDQLLASESPVFLVDCREPNEHAYCQIESATLIPMQQTREQLETFRAQLDSCDDLRIIIFCHHGMRSLHVARFLRSQGLPQVQSMSGGIDRWSLKIDPEVPRY